MLTVSADRSCDTFDTQIPIAVGIQRQICTLWDLHSKIQHTGIVVRIERNAILLLVDVQVILRSELLLEPVRNWRLLEPAG